MAITMEDSTALIVRIEDGGVKDKMKDIAIDGD